mgnify:CR=1 FL=1
MRPALGYTQLHAAGVTSRSARLIPSQMLADKSAAANGSAGGGTPSLSPMGEMEACYFLLFLQIRQNWMNATVPLWSSLPPLGGCCSLLPDSCPSMNSMSCTCKSKR